AGAPSVIVDGMLAEGHARDQGGCSTAPSLARWHVGRRFPPDGAGCRRGATPRSSLGSICKFDITRRANPHSARDKLQRIARDCGSPHSRSHARAYKNPRRCAKCAALVLALSYLATI